YVPAANYNGETTFEYTARDGYEGAATGTVTVRVTPVNDAPVAADVTAATDEEAFIDIALPVSDVDGDPLTTTIVSQPSQNGTVTCTATVCRYTPRPDFFGTETFTYKVSDGKGGVSETKTVTVNVKAVLRETKITAEPVVRINPLSLGLRFRAVLTRKSNGQV